MLKKKINYIIKSIRVFLNLSCDTILKNTKYYTNISIK